MIRPCDPHRTRASYKCGYLWGANNYFNTKVAPYIKSQGDLIWICSLIKNINNLIKHQGSTGTALWRRWPTQACNAGQVIWLQRWKPSNIFNPSNPNWTLQKFAKQYSKVVRWNLLHANLPDLKGLGHIIQSVLNRVNNLQGTLRPVSNPNSIIQNICNAIF